MARIPRFYQSQAVEAAFGAFDQKLNPILALPTGAGKSLVMAMIAWQICQYPGVRVMLAQHVQELIEQNMGALLDFYPDANTGIYSAGLGRYDADKQISLVSVQSAYKCAEVFGKQNILLIDEAHLVDNREGARYETLINGLRATNPKMLIAGLSATPWRPKLGHLSAGGFFDTIAYDITGWRAFERLIEMGYLVRLTSQPTEFSFDLSQVRTTGGEYNKKDLNSAIANRRATEKALQEAWDRGHDRKHWLLFCVGIPHIEMTHEILKAHGFDATYVHSKMTDKGQRREAIQGFKMGHYNMIASDGILTTGFDSPWVDHIVMLLATKVVGKHVQILGRGTRPYYAPGYNLESEAGRLMAIEASGKYNCLISDFGRNLDRLGPINDPLMPGRRLGKGEAPIKICKPEKIVKGDGCGEYNYSGARYCCNCGAEFIFDEAPKIGKEASKAKPMKVTESPVLVWTKVERVEYDEWRRIGAPVAMKVHYYSGYHRYTEMLALESEIPYARKRARDWWRDHGVDPPPPNTMEGLKRVSDIPVPKWVLVQVNKKWPLVVQISFDIEKPELLTFEDDHAENSQQSVNQ